MGHASIQIFELRCRVGSNYSHCGAPQRPVYFAQPKQSAPPTPFELGSK